MRSFGNATKRVTNQGQRMDDQAVKRRKNKLRKRYERACVIVHWIGWYLLDQVGHGNGPYARLQDTDRKREEEAAC